MMMRRLMLMASVGATTAFLLPLKPLLPLPPPSAKAARLHSTARAASSASHMQSLAREAEASAQALQGQTAIPILTTPPDMLTILESYDNFLFDCDGVLWQGMSLFPDVDATLALLRSLGKRVFFVTNNSSKSRQQYLKKFEALGLQASVEEVLPSSWAAAEYLASAHPGVKKAFVVGAQGLVDELGLVGIECIGGQDPNIVHQVFHSDADMLKVEVDPSVGAVVCGWDMTFNYVKLFTASLYLQKVPDCVFVATNRDAFDRMVDRNFPGNGCALASIETSVGREAILTGKPSPWLIDRLLTKHSLAPHRTVVVGDRLDTDILLAAHGHTASILVLTGCTGPADITALPPAGSSSRGIPSIILPHLGMLARKK